MPSPAVVGNVNAVRTDLKRAVEVVEVVRRPTLALLITCRSSSGQQGPCGGVGHVEPVPVGAMDGDEPPGHLGESERKRDRLAIVIATVERQRHPTGTDVDDLAVTAVIIDDGGKITARR